MRPDWVAKDPRLCLTLPLWRELLTPACIVAHRDPLSVARSLHSRDAIPISSGIALWEAYARHAVHHSRDLDRLFVDYTELVRSPQETTDHIADWLEHRRTAPLAGRSVSPVRADGGRHNVVEGEVLAHLNPSQQQLLRAIEAVLDSPSAERVASLDALSAERLSDDARSILRSTAPAAHQQ